MARFLVDESLPAVMRDRLNAAGHEAVHAYDLGLASAPDEAIADRASAEGRIVVTLDLGFGDRAVRGEVGAVIIRARKKIEIGELIDQVMGVLAESAAELEDLEGKVLVIESGRARLRARAED